MFVHFNGCHLCTINGAFVISFSVKRQRHFISIIIIIVDNIDWAYTMCLCVCVCVWAGWSMNLRSEDVNRMRHQTVRVASKWSHITMATAETAHPVTGTRLNMFSYDVGVQACLALSLSLFILLYRTVFSFRQIKLAPLAQCVVCCVFKFNVIYVVVCRHSILFNLFSTQHFRHVHIVQYWANRVPSIQQTHFILFFGSVNKYTSIRTAFGGVHRAYNCMSWSTPSNKPKKKHVHTHMTSSTFSAFTAYEPLLHAKPEHSILYIKRELCCCVFL